MRVTLWPVGRIVVVVLGALCGLGAILALIDASTALRTPLAFLFLFLAPGAAVAMLLSDAAPLTRVAIGIGTAIVINTMVAQIMLLFDAWSIRAGVAMTGVISAYLFALGLIVNRGASAPDGGPPT